MNQTPSAYEQALLTRILRKLELSHWGPSFVPETDPWSNGWEIRVCVGGRSVAQAAVSKSPYANAAARGEVYLIHCFRKKIRRVPSRRPHARRVRPNTRLTRPDHNACRRYHSAPTLEAAVRQAVDHVAKFHRRQPDAPTNAGRP